MSAGLNHKLPTVAVVADDPTRLAAVRKQVVESGFRVALDAAAADVEIDRVASKAQVLIFFANLASRNESVLRELKRANRPLVVCSDAVDTPTLRWAVDKGADGVVWTYRLGETLVPTVLSVSVGQLSFPTAFRRSTLPSELTNREKQALSLLVMGFSNLEIAKKLFISESTVKSHLNTAYRKLGVGSRTEAAERITDPEEGLGTGILAITPTGLSRRHSR